MAIELGTLEKVTLTTVGTKEAGHPTMEVTLKLSPRSVEVIQLVEHLANHETLMVSVSVLQPQLPLKEVDAVAPVSDK